MPRKGVITLNMSLFVTPEERELMAQWHAEEQSKRAAANGDGGDGYAEEEDVSMLGSLVQGMKNMILGDEDEGGGVGGGNDEKDGNSSAESVETGKGQESTVEKRGEDGEHDEKKETMEDEKEDAFILARRRQQECVFPLAPRDVKKSEETLLSLKALFIAEEPSLRKLAELRGFDLVDAKQLRIRELDKQTVPRYVFRDNAKSLSKVKRITGSKRLAIQLLAEPEQLSNHAKLYFVQHRDLESKINSPGWPCNEIKLDVGPNPSLANLHAVLLKAPKEKGDEVVHGNVVPLLGGLAYAKGITDYKHLEIARWDAKTLQWRRVANKSASGGKKRKGKNGKRGGPARLTLQDGDLLAFTDSRTHPGNPEDIKWDREEDMLAQQYKQVCLFVLFCFVLFCFFV